jgi:hypothetical protein
MWDPGHLTTLWASRACYGDNFTSSFTSISFSKRDWNVWIWVLALHWSQYSGGYTVGHSQMEVDGTQLWRSSFIAHWNNKLSAHPMQERNGTSPKQTQREPLRCCCQGMEHSSIPLLIGWAVEVGTGGRVRVSICRESPSILIRIQNILGSNLGTTKGHPEWRLINSEMDERMRRGVGGWGGNRSWPAPRTQFPYLLIPLKIQIIIIIIIIIIMKHILISFLSSLLLCLSSTFVHHFFLVTITILDMIHRPVFYLKLNSIGFSVPHRKRIIPPLWAQQVNAIYWFVTMVY